MKYEINFCFIGQIRKILLSLSLLIFTMFITYYFLNSMNWPKLNFDTLLFVYMKGSPNLIDINRIPVEWVTFYFCPLIMVSNYIQKEKKNIHNTCHLAKHRLTWLFRKISSYIFILFFYLITFFVLYLVFNLALKQKIALDPKVFTGFGINALLSLCIILLIHLYFELYFNTLIALIFDLGILCISMFFPGTILPFQRTMLIRSGIYAGSLWILDISVIILLTGFLFLRFKKYEII